MPPPPLQGQTRLNESDTNREEKVKCHRSDGPDWGQEVAAMFERGWQRGRQAAKGSKRTALALENSVGRRRRRRTRAAASSRRADTLHSALQLAPARRP